MNIFNITTALLTAVISIGYSPGVCFGKVLEGGIKHLDLMPSVKQEYRKGQYLKGNALKKLDPSNRWVKIPKWMAGTWLIRNEVNVYRKNFKTGESSSRPHKFKATQKFIYGMQMDKQGGIWHYVGVPYKSVTKRGSSDEIHLVREKNYAPYNEYDLEFRSYFQVLLVSRSSKKIKDSYQQESITTYRPYMDGTGDIELEGSSKSFDEDGNPLVRSDNEARVKSMAKFKEVRTYKGKDMRKSFREFLLSTGREHLLPD